jgi:glycosyltransferase involved in cell wall biosynthesis
MNILWHALPRYDSLLVSGANLRFLNLIKELDSQGHRVFLLLDDFPWSDPGLKESFARRIQNEFRIAGLRYFDLEFPFNPSLATIIHKLTYPGLVNKLLKTPHSQMATRVLEFISECDIDVFISSARGRLWLIPYLNNRVVTAVDWCDSNILASARELRFLVSSGNIQKVPTVLKALILAIAQEGYYGKIADLNILASPADAACTNRFSRSPQKTHVIYNGVNSTQRRSEKISKRLIFTGCMSFPPNHQSALWFVDHVLPLVVAKDPEIKLVIAGADPQPELQSRAGANVHVMGFVEDMGEEISLSELYVVPMITGSGFKNKVAEAIVNGTYAVGTPMAFEFLDKQMQDLLLIGKTPKEFADHILMFFQNPKHFDGKLKALQKLMVESFQWSSQTELLIQLIKKAQHRLAGCNASQHHNHETDPEGPS